MVAASGMLARSWQHLRSSCGALAVAGQAGLAAGGVFAHTTTAGLATKAVPAAASAAASKDWNAVSVPESTAAGIPTTVRGQSFAGDLRSTSGLGKGDGITSHTAKWLQGNNKSPMEYIRETEPIKVTGMVVASHGSDDPALGCPVEYIDLRGTTYDKPAVCKYTGNKFYSDTWKSGGHH